MPLKPHPSKQLTTFKIAKSIYDQLANLGVPISGMQEIALTGQIIPVDNPDYNDDGTMNQYDAIIFGGRESLPLAALEIARFGGFNGFKALATSCKGGDQLAGVMAVLAMPGRTKLLDDSLPFTSPIAPDPGDDPSVGSHNVINGPGHNPGDFDKP